MESADLKGIVGNLAVIFTMIQFLSGALVCKQYMVDDTTGESSPLPFISCILSFTMPLSSAERQRRYREKLKESNPEKWEQLKIKNARRTKMQYKKVEELSEAEKLARRKKWRKIKQKYDSKGNSKMNMKIQNKNRKLYQQKYSIKYRRLTKELKKANEKLKSMCKENKALKKRIYRQKLLSNIKTREEEEKENTQEMNPNDAQENVDTTPDARADFLIHNLDLPSPIKNKIKQELLEKYVLEAAMQKQYKNLSKNHAKALMKNIINDDLVKKYKMRKRFQNFLGLKAKARISRKLPVKHRELKTKIENFFLQDDVSRATAGKRETKTSGKIKMQRRYLLDSMKNLRNKFIQETGVLVSYSTFTRYKPFYVLIPNVSNRETCACKKHSNIEYKFNALKKQSIFKYPDLKALLEATVCSIKNKTCMYSECEKCKKISPDYDLSQNDQLNETVTWMEWIIKDVVYKKVDQVKKTKKSEKEIKNGQLQYLITEFEKELREFKRHIYNISHQYNTYKYLKNHLKSNEILLHCDFSENYTTKLHTEIQAKHFFQDQITLHTSVVYKEADIKQSYCTLSNSKKHTPEAIWAHLFPLLSSVRSITPEIDTLHVFSDGPSSQYRQKKNFYLFNLLTKELGFKKASWHFFEASHGKGAADAIGGHVKRYLDQKVAYGFDIPDAETAVEVMNDRRVRTYLISEEDICSIEARLKDLDLVPVPETLKIHQIMSTQDINHIRYRFLSCFCGNEKGFCECYMKTHCLLKEKISEKRTFSTSEDENVTHTKAKKKTKRTKNPKIVYSSSDDENKDENSPAVVQPKVTILSNIKVNYKPHDLKDIVKGSCSYNISTDNLKRDFKELFTLPTHKENRRNNYLTLRDFSFTDSESD